MCGLCIICKTESQQHASANMLSFLQPPTMQHFNVHHESFSFPKIYNRFVVGRLAAAASVFDSARLVVYDEFSSKDHDIKK
jgi:hypothetical protein